METQQTLETISSQKRAVSARKAQANRQNALKSTGPKTLTGKAHSRRNSLKHGFFAKDLISGVLFPREDPREFRELHAQLRQESQPVGISEELEVERIAACWWKLKRVWRYENAEISSALNDVAKREYIDPREVMSPEHRTLISLLQNAEKEIEASGEISQEFKEKVFATEPLLRKLWPRFEEAAERVIEQGAEMTARRMVQELEQQREVLQELAEAGEVPELPEGKPSWRQVKDFFQPPREHARLVARTTTEFAIEYLERFTHQAVTSLLNISRERQAIPNSDALDKILHYAAAAERDLGRALDRLERLQRRRQGELVPPPVNVRLTR